ncbi:MAG: hypothetical protein PHY30_02340, partial [Candidatus Pacebacteria bacterium]|nr:hypothetical protein [Candidatus Paceibacterota bacterium]
MNHLELILAMIDEIWKSIEKDLRRRPGPKPIIHDADIIKLIILRNLLGFRHESSFLRFMETFELKRFFPLLPCQSRFN